MAQWLNRFCCVCLLPLAVVGAERPGRKWTTLQRVEIQHLQAVHEARLRFAKERVELRRPGVYEDFRAVLHVHAEDAAHTGGTRPEALAAARKTGVRVVLFTDHSGPKPDTWQGLRDGVLFLACAEDDGVVRCPASSAAPELRFLAHVEDRLDAPGTGFDGMEIYNRHTDSKDETEFHQYLGRALKDPEQWRKLAENFSAYPDEFFAAEADYWPQILARFDRETQTRPFTGMASNDAHQNVKFQQVLFDPYEVSFRNVSTHLLARELTQTEIRRSLAEGHAYVAHDWLCDPAGFAFVASNNLGLFEMGDPAPLAGRTRLSAQAPLAARWKLFRNGSVVQETTGARMDFLAQEPGAYRVEAWLALDGEERPWIYSNPIYLQRPPVEALLRPAAELSAGVQVERDITYTEGKPEDAAKHKLDLYLPKQRKGAAVFVFIHGGVWRSGDRSLYTRLGNRFAKEGLITVVPSYRLAPQNPHPAQIEDVAAAFAWVLRNIPSYGADPQRIFLGGHSAGGHLAALAALDQRYLKKRGLSSQNIRAVLALSGVYEIRGLENVFGTDEQIRKEASPIHHVSSPAPRFLITYCQWDYETLPAQARQFHQALQKAGVASELVFIPKRDHISEMLNIDQEDDPTAAAILRVIR